MTIQHGNRIRQTGGKQVAQEVQAVETFEPTLHEPTEAEIRARAFEIYLSRNGAPGRDEADWLQAETELRASRPGSHSNEIARSRGARGRS